MIAEPNRSGGTGRGIACLGAPADLGQLLDRAARGDAEAFAEFYDATVAGAFRLAQLSLTDPGRVDQVLRLSYVRALREADRYPASGRSPQEWLMGHVRTWHAQHAFEVDAPGSWEPTADLPLRATSP